MEGSDTWHTVSFITKLPHWIKHEEDVDARIKNKGKYGMNSHTVYYVVETEARLEVHRYNHPGRILLCDRAYIQDTPKRRIH